jgi:hypothetical protein
MTQRAMSGRPYKRVDEHEYLAQWEEAVCSAGPPGPAPRPMV